MKKTRSNLLLKTELLVFFLWSILIHLIFIVYLFIHWFVLGNIHSAAWIWTPDPPAFTSSMLGIIGVFYNAWF